MLIRVEMMVALQVAKNRRSGAETPIRNRMNVALFALRADPEKTAFGGPRSLDDIRGAMTFAYRRAYGDQWWTMLSGELLASFAKYQNHPDPGQFCRLAEQTARHALFMQGPDQIVHLGRMYRQLAPGNAPQPTKD